MDKKIAEHVCLYGENYLDNDFTHCETCIQYDWTSPAQVRKECKDIEAILALIASEQKPMVEALKKVIAWNEEYPSSRIYGETTIRKIAAEMDAINEEAKKALAKIDAVLPKGEGK